MTLIRLGGAALVLAAVAFSAVFAFLATQFHYPEVLDAPAAQALPALLAMGETGRAVWAVYGVLPLLLVPASLGAYAALKRASQGGMALAVLMAVIAAVAMMLGLMRWPSIQWEIARVYATASPEGRALLTAVFDGLNRYLGNYLGEFVGELCLSTFFFLSGRAMLRSDGFARWMGWAGVASGAIGWIAMWRNVTAIVAPVAQVNNAVLPIWMIVFGVVLLRSGRGGSHEPARP